MAEENKEENKQQNNNEGNNIGKTLNGIEFAKVEDKFNVMVTYHSNSELLTLKFINQTTKNVYKQAFNKENVHKITDECKLQPDLVVKMIIDTLTSKELTAKNIRIFLLPNITQATAKYDEIRALKGIPDAINIPTGFEPKLSDNNNNENNQLENCLLFVMHFSAPPYIYFNYCFIIKQKDVSDNDKLTMRVNDLQKENISLKQVVNTLSNTVEAQQQQITRLTQSLNAADNSINALTQRMQQLENKFDEEQKAADDVIRFDRYNETYIATETSGTRIKTISSSCAYYPVFSSKGFNSGIKRWKVKIVARKHGSTETVGVATNIFDGSACYNKTLVDHCGGIDSGKQLENGDVISIELNFNTRKIIFLKNNNALKTADIVNGTTYYPAVQLCGCSGQIIQVVD